MPRPIELMETEDERTLYRRLQTIPANRVLRMLRARERGEALTQEMREILAVGDKLAQKKYRVSAFLQRCKLHGNQEDKWFGTKDAPAEVYVVGYGIDLRGQGQAVGEAKNVFQGVTRDASRSLVVSVSKFGNMWDNQQLPLIGNGIVLYGPQDPHGLLELHVSIMEDDGAYRKLGQAIEDAAKQVNLPGLVKDIGTAAGASATTIGAIGSALGAIASIVSMILKQNEDDVIQDVHFSSLRHQGYLPGEKPFNYTASEGSAEGKLLIDVEVVG